MAHRNPLLRDGVNLETPLNASASTAGELLSSSTFEIPQFQREYSWGKDEVSEFWSDLSKNLTSDSYFLGLIILTNQKKRRYVVDGQQRLITISLLASALYHESIRLGRKSLAEKIRSTFLETINYDSDEKIPRIVLSDEDDNETFYHITQNGSASFKDETGSDVSENITDSYKILLRALRADLKIDPFKRLGLWTDFLTNHVYFAVFVHGDLSTAYQVYEVINTRGKDLTTADLLKNYVLYQTSEPDRNSRYAHWKSIASQFNSEGANNFVQYIRHAITVHYGHVLPKDLYAFLSGRLTDQGRVPPGPDDLMDILDAHLPLYLQMIDPTLPGPASPGALEIFSALNHLNVIAVRPILLAMANLPDSLEAMQYVLRLVVRRVVVGNLGTGNVERRFGEAAKKVSDDKSWKGVVADFRDLNPHREDFVDQLSKRSLSKSLLAFTRRSAIQGTMTPEPDGVLHFIAPPSANGWGNMSEEDGAYWTSTIGNTVLADLDKRPPEAGDWEGFKETVLPYAIEHEWTTVLDKFEDWDATAIELLGKDLSQEASDVWYGPAS